jgi:hypothetical protein
MAAPLAAGALSVLVGLYGYALPFLVLAVWAGMALWDLAQREDLSRGASVGWAAAVVVLPGVGALAYHVGSGSPMASWLRWTLLAGGVAAYVLVLLLGGLVGGVV